MRPPPRFLALPTSLLLLLLSSSLPAHAKNDDQSPARWPDEHKVDFKYSPDDSLRRKREVDAVQAHLAAGHAPVVVRKMSEDESEMFFPEYWGFREQQDQLAMFSNDLIDDEAGRSLRKEFEEDEARMLANVSTTLSMRPPFLVRGKKETTLSRRDIQLLAVDRVRSGRSAAAVLALLEKRQFACPSGTSACSNAPSLCCATGENCVSVIDTGIGTIGCCPMGYTCSGTIQCVGGNTPCASDIGGGCCVPGDVCATVGCVPSSAASSAIVSSSAVTSATTSAVTVVTTLTQTPQSSQTSVNLIVVTTVVTPSIPASTSTLTLTASASSTPVTITNTTTTSQATTPSTATATTSASAPGRASVTGSTTQVTTSSTTSTTSTSSSATDSSCPTGFYACSAYYAGPCCRTGRDCATTDCPSTASTTLLSSGATVVVPLTGAATTTASGTCATGWYSCAPTDGGSCCPSGWACGGQSCTSVGPTSTQTEAQEGLSFGGAGRPGLSLELVGLICFMISLLLMA